MGNNKKNRERYSSLEQTTLSDKIAIWVLAFSSAIIPLVVFMYASKLEGILFATWTGVEHETDFFSYWKAQLLLVSLIALSLVWLYKVLSKQVNRLYSLFIPLAVYFFMVILSTVFSEHINVALQGFVERHEGAYVLITYCILTFTAALTIKNEKDAERLVFITLVSCTIIALIGISQFYGFDFLQSDIGKKLMLPKQYEAEAQKLSFSFAGQKIMYTTVYNPNYLGSYSALIFPVSLGLLYAWIEKGRWKAILGYVFAAASFVLFIGGMSSVGLVGGIVALLCFIVIFRKRLIKYWVYSIGLVVLLSGIYISMDLTSGGSVSREFIKAIPLVAIENQTGSVNQGTETNSDPSQPVRSTLVKDFIVDGNTVTFETESEKLIGKYENSNLQFVDSDGKQLVLNQTETVFTFQDERYKLYKVTSYSNGFVIEWNNNKLPIVISDNKLYFNKREGVLLDKIDTPETFGFKGHELFASSRGYIWSRSIPMLKKTLLIGHGPDTYAIYFPQNEVAAKINFLFNPTSVVDKPHSWYLQLGINTGVVSLIAMLVFLAWYWFKGLFLWFRDVSGMGKAIGASIFCGVTGYLVAAIGNDSVVSVAPVFWVLLGVGIAFVYKYAPAKRTAAKRL